VPLHVERLSRTMVKAGTSTTLVYPAGLPMWVDHFTNENARSITVYTGISAADRALLQTTASAGEDPREAAADLDELDLDYRAGSPLYRVTRLEELMCERLHDTAFGIEGWEAVLYLLCDILPEVPWIEIGDVLADFGPRTYIEVPSLEISAREVASAYAEYVREMVPGALPRTSPKSAWPSQLVAFVLEYRHTHGARPTWAEIHEAWLAVHPGVYGSLQSFRNTFNRVVKRYPDPGELPGDRDRSAQTRSPRRQT